MIEERGSQSLLFQVDIRPLFRAGDIRCMIAQGIQLDDYESVKENARAIYNALAQGFMPPDSPWPSAQVEKFKKWIDEGMAK